jgi:hypothetical protein
MTHINNATMVTISIVLFSQIQNGMPTWSLANLVAIAGDVTIDDLGLMPITTVIDVQRSLATPWSIATQTDQYPHQRLP